MALGDSGQRLTMIEPDPTNTGMHRIAPGPESKVAPRVAVTTLDEFLRNRESFHIDWIKIDVEGYEARVVRGAISTIERCRPELFVEVDDRNLMAQGDSAVGVLRLLEQLGYDIHDAATGRTVGPDSDLEGCHIDVLCVHRQA